MAISRPSFRTRTRQVVYREASTRPYVGFEHLTTVPDGWEYDIKRWCSAFDLNYPALPRLLDPSLQGVSESEYFLSGVGSVISNDLYIKELIKQFIDYEHHWVPDITHGHYYRYRTPYFYYGDNSRVEYVDPDDNIDSRSYILLDQLPDLSSPILAATFRRHPDTSAASYKTLVNQAYKFTGIYSGGEEAETVDAAGRIYWSNVDTTKKEFVVDHTIDGSVALYFNKDYTRQYGAEPVSYADLGACKLIGISNGSEYQTFYLPHFPVLADDSFHVYVADNSSWTEWTRVDTWWEFLNTATYPSNRYFLDKDLGIVYFGSAANGGVPALGRYIVAAYTTTLRVEYEEQDRCTDINPVSADTNPVAQHVSQGFVCITHSLLEPASISLNIDKSPIAFTSEPVEYGPVVTGSDYAVLRATVKDPQGTVLPGIEVGFEMTPSTTGYLNGSSSSVSATNGHGYAYTSYQPPVSADSLGHYTTTVRTSTSPYYPNSKDVIIRTTKNLGLEGKEDEIYLYQILKDDLLLGYDSVDEYLYDNVDQPAWVQDSNDYAEWKAEMILDYNLQDWQGVAADGTIAGRKVVIYKLDDTTLNTDAYAVHPVTGEYGAVVPLRPSLIERITDSGDAYYNMWRLIYPEDAVPDCDPDDSGVATGGYWIVGSKLINFKAHCWSPYYNRIIYSNEITARISLPDYLLGEYINSALKKIPFGWKLLDSGDNVAAGMDGATFLTVNPHPGPYQILDLVHSTDPTGAPTGWANAPFKSIGFQFQIVT